MTAARFSQLKIGDKVRMTNKQFIYSKNNQHTNSWFKINKNNIYTITQINGIEIFIKETGQSLYWQSEDFDWYEPINCPDYLKISQ